jgi:hypothetical protein
MARAVRDWEAAQRETEETPRRSDEELRALNETLETNLRKLKLRDGLRECIRQMQGKRPS